MKYFVFFFPNAKFTILGDINQTIAKQEDLTLYEQIQKILKKRTSSLITLDKSFRCTNEILNYSLNFIEHSSKIVSYNRKGDNISVVSVDRYEVLVDEIIGELEICREKGFKTIGLICKTQKNCVRLFQFLKDEINVQLINNESAVELQGIFILPVYMSKGLEFDAVLLCDANLQNYSDEEDKNILYVACTRALHRLSLFSEGPISLWLTEI